MRTRAERINGYTLTFQYNQRQYADLVFYAPTCNIAPFTTQLSFFDKGSGKFTQDVFLLTVAECDELFERLKEIISRISQHRIENDNWDIFKTKLTACDAECCNGKTEEQIVEYLEKDPRFKLFFDNKYFYFSTADLGASLFKFIDERMIAVKQALQKKQEDERAEESQYMDNSQVLELLREEIAAKECELRNSDINDFYEKQKHIYLLENIASSLSKM